MPLAGETGPTTAMYLTIPSAERDRLVKADFDSPDDLPSRCSQFEVIHAGQDGTPHKIAMIKAPHVGEKAYALVVPSDAATAAVGSVGLRVLSGTLSVTLALEVPKLTQRPTPDPPC